MNINVLYRPGMAMARVELQHGEAIRAEAVQPSRQALSTYSPTSSAAAVPLGAAGALSVGTPSLAETGTPASG